LFWILLNEEIGDMFGFEACVAAEFFQGNEFASFLFEFLADAGEELTGGAVSTTSYIHNIFGIDDYPVGYRVHSIWIGEQRLL
jgi:hypothetical protein